MRERTNPMRPHFTCRMDCACCIPRRTSSQSSRHTSIELLALVVGSSATGVFADLATRFQSGRAAPLTWCPRTRSSRICTVAGMVRVGLGAQGTIHSGRERMPLRTTQTRRNGKPQRSEESTRQPGACESRVPRYSSDTYNLNYIMIRSLPSLLEVFSSCSSSRLDCLHSSEIRLLTEGLRRS